jgi:peptide/nickel transport system permease protein
MTRFLVRRLLGGLVVLWVVSLLTFAIFFMAPGNPAVAYAGRTPSAAAIKATEQRLGLNEPVPVQYWRFLSGIFAGRDYVAGAQVTHCPAPCLGYSFKTNENVSDLIGDRLPVTISIALGAAVLWLVAGVAAGVVSGVWPGSIWDRLAMVFALAGVSVPVYFTALLSQQAVVYQWHWLPVINYAGFGDNPLIWARNLLLPWLCIAFLYAALYARITRTTMIETMREDYIRTARAKGLRERRVVLKHGLRAGLTPVVTLAGLDLGGLLGGAVIVEYVFGLKGIGKLAVDAIGDQNLPVILGVTLVAAAFIVVANILVDVLYAVVDPRVRLA